MIGAAMMTWHLLVAHTRVEAQAKFDEHLCSGIYVIGADRHSRRHRRTAGVVRGPGL